MWYFVYFNAAATSLFAIVALYNRRCAGIVFTLLAAALQIGAFQLYAHEWERLAGEPDRLYVWIVPLAMLVLSIPISIAAIVRNVWVSMRRSRPSEILPIFWARG